MSSRANAQKLIQISGAERTVMVTVPIGKSQDVRTGNGFANISVGDPEVADVIPLTDHSLSILGKKIGTTRVSIYGGDKALVGVFDIEVTYDTSILATELRERFPGSRLRVVAMNGHVMISGTAPDAVTADKAVSIAKQFGAEVINSVRILQPQQVMLEVRFVEASRTAGRELGINWNVVAKNFATTLGTGALVSANVPF